MGRGTVRGTRRFTRGIWCWLRVECQDWVGLWDTGWCPGRCFGCGSPTQESVTRILHRFWESGVGPWGGIALPVRHALPGSVLVGGPLAVSAGFAGGPAGKKRLRHVSGALCDKQGSRMGQPALAPDLPRPARRLGALQRFLPVALTLTVL